MEAQSALIKQQQGDIENFKTILSNNNDLQKLLSAMMQVMVCIYVSKVESTKRIAGKSY